MAVSLKQINVKDPELREVQQNVADAVQALAAEESPAVGVISVSSNQKLVGNEDVVLVDASTSTSEIALVLPGPRLLRKLLTVKVTKAGSNPVRIKATDIPATGSPTIDGNASAAIPAGSATALRIVSDGRNYWTL